ncbi:MAG TPA: PH domain-containing protein [Mycobacteriales bacterium]|nr:PH domain-containing protein [Mycobacteriales bacterium]
MRAGLVSGEEIVLDLRPHPRRLAGPAALVPVVVGLAAYGLAAMPAGRLRSAERISVLLVAVLVLAFGSLRPWLRWRGTRLLVTNRRVLVRVSVLSRRGRDIPLARISDVSFQQRLVERIWRSGTLVVDTTGEAGRVVVTDVPRVESVHTTLLELLESRLGARVTESGEVPR